MAQMTQNNCHWTLVTSLIFWCAMVLVPCKWNFLFPSVTCIVYSVVALNVSLTLLCENAKFK